MFPELFRDDVFRLETRRLWLRWPTARDEAAIERFAGAREVAAMTARIPHPYPKGTAASFIYHARVANAQGSALTFMLAPLARPHEAIGTIDLHDEDGVPTLGYCLGLSHWGKGLMSEAVVTLTATTFLMTGFETIGALVRKDHPASRRVLEKAGFLQTGERRVMFPARGAEFDCAVYSLARESARTASSAAFAAREG
jgi:RimJ/RimL family protein N-acetyltransferase